AALLDSLGEDYAGDLATYSQTQKIGFIYRTDAVAKRSVAHILEEFSSDFAGRPPLEMTATVTLPDTSLVLSFISVHLKCCPDLDSYERKKQAAQRIKSRIDFLRPNDAIIILGDFNDFVTKSMTSGMPSPFENFVNDSDRYRFVTLEAEERGEESYIGWTLGSMIDHILITHPLFDAYEEGSARVLDEARDAVQFYSITTSDHLPVYSSFRFTTGTGGNGAPELPRAATASAPYPNPTSSQATIDFELPSHGWLRIDLYDARGRKVRTIEDHVRTAGTYQQTLDVSRLATGTYFIRIVTEGASVVRPLVVIR
ncbi:MAG: T9SS type A sorting domain-containing protein, partial [Bacteroidota bacterium]